MVFSESSEESGTGPGAPQTRDPSSVGAKLPPPTEGCTPRVRGLGLGWTAAGVLRSEAKNRGEIRPQIANHMLGAGSAQKQLQCLHRSIFYEYQT